jgi:hypothetical protein
VIFSLNKDFDEREGGSLIFGRKGGIPPPLNSDLLRTMRTRVIQCTLDERTEEKIAASREGGLTSELSILFDYTFYNSVSFLRQCSSPNSSA